MTATIELPDSVTLTWADTALAPPPAPLGAAAVRPRLRRERWPWAVAAAALAVYVVVGWWLMYTRNFAINDTLWRTLYAKQMLFSRDPHLGVVGFYWMPFPTLSRVPVVALLHPLGRSEFAGPLTSAVFAALTVPVVAATARMLQLAGWLRVVVTLLAAFSPVSIWLGANGYSESTLVFFIAAALHAFVRWRLDGRTASLVLLAVSLAGASMTRWEAGLVLPAIGVIVALCTERGRRVPAMIVALTPSAFVFGWWLLATKLITGQFLFFLEASKVTTSTPADASWLPTDRSMSSIIGYSGFVVGALAPALLAVAVGAIVVWRRWRTSLGLLAVALVIPVVITLQVYRGDSWGTPRFYIMTPICATVGVLWLWRVSDGRRLLRVVAVCGLVLLVGGTVSATLMLGEREYTSAEGDYLFFGAITGSIDPNLPVPAANAGPNLVIQNLASYRELVADLDPLLAADPSMMVAVPSLSVALTLTEHPDSFLAPEDRDFDEIMSDPADRFDLVILQTFDVAAGKSELQALVGGFSEGGEWVQIADYGGLSRVYDWVPAGEEPLALGDGGDASVAPAP